MDREARRPRGRGRHRLAHRMSAPAHVFDESVDLFDATSDELKRRKLGCILVDEAQFLSQQHVLQLCEVADRLSIPVLCYGLRTDFRASSSPGRPPCSRSRMMVELKAVCECGRKATMNLRVDEEGKAVAAGAQTEIGGNDRTSRYAASTSSNACAKARPGR